MSDTKMVAPQPAALVGMGSNKLRVICMIFPTYEMGEDWLAKTFGWSVRPYSTAEDPDDGCATPQSRDLRCGLVFDKGKQVDLEHTEEEYAEKYAKKVGAVDATKRFKWEVAHKLFVSYYSGCGACYGLMLREVPYGEPLVSFDLD